MAHWFKSLLIFKAILALLYVSEIDIKNVLMTTIRTIIFQPETKIMHGMR